MAAHGGLCEAHGGLCAAQALSWCTKLARLVLSKTTQINNIIPVKEMPATIETVSETKVSLKLPMAPKIAPLTMHVANEDHPWRGTQQQDHQ